MRQLVLSDVGVKFGTSGVRGLVSELTDSLSYAFALAFSQRIYPEQSVAARSRVVLGHDLRPSSPRISAACAQALSDSGIEVIYVGALPTPAIACYAMQSNLPAIVVTGSHIPFDRNGIKFYTAEGEIDKADEIAIASSVVSIPDVIDPFSLGKPVETARINYLNRYTNVFGADLCQGMRIGVYQHSSVARDILVELFSALGADVVSLGRTDQFVPIDTEAVRVEDQLQAKSWAQEVGFDLLVSTDGDADRPLIADETGTFLRGDMVGVLCARYLGVQAVVTPVSSNTSVERSGWFEQVVRTRIGSPYVIDAMNRMEALSVAGYEANGGFLLGTDVELETVTLSALPTRDAVLPMLALIALAKQYGVKISELVSEPPERYTASGRIAEVDTLWSNRLLDRLERGEVGISDLVPKALGNPVSIDRTDGYRVGFSSGDIVHLRPSGNAPELRCYTESSDAERAQMICDGVLSRVKQLFQADTE